MKTASKLLDTFSFFHYMQMMLQIFASCWLAILSNKFRPFFVDKVTKMFQLKLLFKKYSRHSLAIVYNIKSFLFVLVYHA